MRKSDRYTVVFALLVCVVCSVLLAATSTALRARQERNADIDRRKNILKAFGLRDVTAEDVQTTFDRYIGTRVIDGATGELDETADADQLAPDQIESGAKLPLYVWEENGEIQSVAFPVSGKGLWSTIYGVLALESDWKTIRGITFYDHGETPGLGGEIDKAWFQDQFEGKTIADEDGLETFRVVKGKVADKWPQGNPHAVDGISGATMTSKGLQEFLNEDLARYDRYFSKRRSGS
jgi:Na+-transporting NADH:ubiquinone oxidoreductase subunit C